MRRYLFSRILQIVFTFFMFASLVYFLLEAQPGDFGQQFLANPDLTQAQKQALRRVYGLDRPMHERYFRYVSTLLRGDLGISFQYHPRPVIDIIKERLPRTLILFLSSVCISYYLGFLAGKILAWRRGQTLEYIATIGGVTLFTVFTPWFALMMIWLFAYTLGWFPVGKFIDPMVWRRADVDANTVFGRMLLTALIASIVLFLLFWTSRRLAPAQRRLERWGGFGLIVVAVLGYWIVSGLGRYAWDILHHLILPVLTLTLISFAGTMLLTRSSMVEVLREDYIMAARAKGLPEEVIRDRHAARNAMLPVVTALIFALPAAVDGGVITETIFSWPGMGLTLLEAALVQDIPLAIGALLITGLLTLLGHLAADLAYAVLDPRIRYG